MSSRRVSGLLQPGRSSWSWRGLVLLLLCVSMSTLPGRSQQQAASDVSDASGSGSGEPIPVCTCNPQGVAEPTTPVCNATGYCPCMAPYTGKQCMECNPNYIFLQSQECVRAGSHFFPFGGEDIVTSIISVPLEQPTPFPFGVNGYSTLHISLLGFVATAAGDPFADGNELVNAIAPFYIIGTATSTGRLYYRFHTSPAVLAQVNATLNSSHSVGAAMVDGFEPLYALVITWTTIRRTSSNSSMMVPPGNTFQLVLTTDGCRSFAIVNYMNGSTAVSQGDTVRITVRQDGEVPWERMASGVAGDYTEVIPLNGLCTMATGERVCRSETAKLAAISPPTDTACPLSSQHAELDLSFSLLQLFSSMCYTNVFAGNLVCCYDSASGSLISDGAMGSFVTSSHPLRQAEVFNNTEWSLRSTCCQAGFCGLFYDKRPAIDSSARLFEQQQQQQGAGEPAAESVALLSVQLRSAQATGDPHFITMDGQNFTFNGLGDYLLVAAYSPGSNTTVMVHIRTVLVPDSSATRVSAVGVAYIAGTAAGQRLAVLEVRLGGAAPLSVFKETENITANLSASSSASSDPVFVTPYMAVQYRDDRVDVTSVSGPVITVRRHITSVFSFLTVQTTLSRVFTNNTRGLLGNMNENTLDDFTSENGTVFTLDLSGMEYYQSVGQSWRVEEMYSLLRAPYSYNSSHVPVFAEDLDLNSLPGVRGACGDSVSCLFDSIQANDTSVGVVTLNTQAVLMEQRSIEANIPPVISASSSPVNLDLGNNVAVQFNVTDPDGGGGAAPQVSLTHTGTFTTTPVILGTAPVYTVQLQINVSMTTVPSITITATDNAGANATFRPLLVFCPCEYGQTCRPLAQGQDSSGQDRGIIAQCNCNNSYTGPYCERDRDGCATALSTCPPSEECVDVPAPGFGSTCQITSVTSAVPATTAPVVTESTSSNIVAWLVPTIIVGVLLIGFFGIFIFVTYKKQGTVTYHVADNDGDIERKKKNKGEVVPLSVINPSYESATVPRERNGTDSASCPQSPQNGAATAHTADTADENHDTYVNDAAVKVSAPSETNATATAPPTKKDYPVIYL